MDVDKFTKHPIKVIGSTGIDQTIKCYVDPDYEFKTYSNTNGSKTGHLIFAELEPNDTQLPGFKFRWDHGDKVVDVDIFQNGKPHNYLWSVEGYKGHHAEKIDEGKREYSFLIEIPGRKIFEGSIRVGLLIGLNLHERITVSEKVNVEIF